MFEDLPTRRASRHDPMVLLSTEDHRTIPFEATQPHEVWAALNPQDHQDLQALCHTFHQMLFALPQGLLTGVAAKHYYHRYQQQPYIKETDWMADHSGGALSKTQMALAQRAYVVAHAPGAACSTSVVWDQTAQQNICMRSLDWAGARQLGQATRLYQFVDRHGTNRFQAVGNIGMVGLLTAIKPGLCAAINYAPWTVWGIEQGLDPLLLLRQLFEDPNVVDYHSALDTLLAWPVSSPVYVTLCGVEKDQACVVEFGLKGMRHVRQSQAGLLVQTNHFDPETSPFVDKNIDMPPHPVFKDLLKMRQRPIEDWYASDLLPSSAKRRQLLEQGLRPFNGDAQQLREKLASLYATPPVWNYETAYHALMIPENGTLQVHARRANPTL
ncbi:hypothetical protein [Magnetococcus sp. PR-3]|uniref:hypothetical protein n=1 Tax=Magnetococcus sp. PR-3 TaxID=3120355 RepID=UPI002FCE04EC